MKDREAAKIADRIERRERSKSKLWKWIEIKKHRGDLIKLFIRILLKEYNKWKVKIWIVKGEVWEIYSSLDFTEGAWIGNIIYSENEVWIDWWSWLRWEKICYIARCNERNLMSKGKNLWYSYKSSSKIEYYW